MKRLALAAAAVLLAACSGPDTRPNVVLDTALGEIEVEVHLDQAPISAADFLLHVDRGLYDGEGFYRVVRADNDPRGMGMSLIQGGILSQEPVTPPIAHERTTDIGMSNTRGTISIARDAPGTGSAAYFFINIGDNDPRGMGMSLIQGGLLSQEPVTPPIAHERTTDIGMSNTRGTISIARDAPGTGSAAFFFINIGDNSFLDTGGVRNPDGEGYAAFGRVVRGMEVVEAIQSGRADAPSDEPVTSGQILSEPVTITRAYRVE